VRLECGERENESRLHEERVSPLDRFLGLRRYALEDRVEPAQLRLAFARGAWIYSAIVLGRLLAISGFEDIRLSALALIRRGVGERTVAIRADDLGNHNVIALVPPGVLALRLQVRGMGRELLERFEIAPVVGRIPSIVGGGLPGFGAQEAGKDLAIESMMPLSRWNSSSYWPGA
jgi:hypothetical protein